MRPEPHPACAAFPPMPESDLAELAADISKNGLVDPVTLTPEGLLLDGRCRWDACERAGVEPRTVVYDGDPAAFVLSKNKHRRHMNKSQMAMAVARLATLQNGSNQYRYTLLGRHAGSAGREVGSEPFTTLSMAALAEQAGISETYVKSGRAVLQHAEPNVLQMVESGQIGARLAAEMIDGVDRSEQAAWSAEDMKRKGAEINKRRRKTPEKVKGAKGKTAKAPPQKVIDPPYMFNKWPTPEETGYPINGTVNEQDEHRARYGRTQLHPMDVTHMLEHEGETASLEVALVSLTGSTKPSAERFFELIDKMLAWTPQPGATNGRERDFAPKARRRLEVLRERVPKALALLQALDDGLRARQTRGNAKDTLWVCN